MKEPLQTIRNDAGLPASMVRTTPRTRLLRFLAAFLTLLPGAAVAQTINTTVGSTNYNGTNSAGANQAITFVIENTSGVAILLTDVKNWYAAGNSGAVSLYASTTSLSGPYGTLTTPTWTLIASGTQTAPTTGIQPINWTGGINYLIPAGSQIRFALLSASICNYSGTGATSCTPSTFTNSGVILKVGDVQIAGQNVGYGGTNNPRWFTGEITFMPAVPCSGPPNAGTTSALPAAPCYGTSSVLSLTGATLATGLTYQWESNPGSGWVPIAGATSNSYTVPSVTGSTQYRCWVKCTNDSTASTPVTLTANPLPGVYTENFEGITANNQLPGCMTATNLSTATRTYTTNQATATNHTAGGSKFGAFFYSPAGTDAFITPALQLQAGTTYLFRLWYRSTDGTNSFTSLSAFYGTSPSVAGLTNFIGSVNPTNPNYQEFTEVFTPTVTGVYYIGIVADHTVTQSNTYLSIDDIGLTSLTPCAGKPDAGTINPVTPCPNQSFTLTRNGGTSFTQFANLSFQWQDSTAAGWQNSTGNSTSWSYTGAITTPTRYRVIVGCNNGGLSDTSDSYLVNVASFLNCYCVPTYVNGGAGDNIVNVVLKNLTNNSAAAGNPLPYYVNYTTQQPGTLPIPTLVMGETDTIKVTYGTDGNQFGAIWIDFNHSGTFDGNEYFTTGVVTAGNGTARIPFTTPLSSAPGITRLRIRGGDDVQMNSGQPCNASNSTWGEGEDYLVNIVFPPCNGPTEAGRAIASDTAICIGYSIDLWDTTHEYRRSQIAWSWENSTDGGFTWNSIPNSAGKDSLSNVLISGAVKFRLRMECTLTGDITYSNVVNVRIKSPYQCYCYSQSNGGATDTSDIGSVTIGAMVNSTGGPHLQNPVAIRRRTDYTDIPNIIMNANGTYRLSIFHTQPNGRHADALVTVFIDYNNDFTYDAYAQPDGERVFQGYTTAGNFYLDTVIRIPNAVIPNVPTGMRIILNNDRNPLSPANLGCGPYVSGETEDYVVMFKRVPQSVSGVNLLEQVALFPNPTTGKFTVRAVASGDMGTVDVQVSSITGQQIMQQQYRNVGSKFMQDLDMGGIARGIYFVEVRTASGDKMVQKLILR